jgi:hypothetical protein
MIYYSLTNTSVKVSKTEVLEFSFASVEEGVAFCQNSLARAIKEKQMPYVNLMMQLQECLFELEA